jgi:hypothetical protein
MGAFYSRWKPVHRLLTTIYKDGTPSDAAHFGGVGLQTVRD